LLQGKKAQYLHTWLDKKSDLENVMLDDYRHERRKQHKRKNKGLGERIRPERRNTDLE
jgi:hypothetical protein